MEMIHDQRSIWQIGADRRNKSRRHICRYCLDLWQMLFIAFPKPFQGITALSIANPENPAGIQASDHCHVLVSLPDCKLINTYTTNTRNIRVLVAAFQVSLLNILDRIPTHMKMIAHVFQGRYATQIYYMSLKSPCVSLTFFGEREMLLPDNAALFTIDSLDCYMKHNFLGTNWYTAQFTLNSSATDDVFALATRASQFLGICVSIYAYFTIFVLGLRHYETLCPKGMEQ